MDESKIEKQSDAEVKQIEGLEFVQKEECYAEMFGEPSTEGIEPNVTQSTTNELSTKVCIVKIITTDNNEIEFQMDPECVLGLPNQAIELHTISNDGVSSRDILMLDDETNIEIKSEIEDTSYDNINSASSQSLTFEVANESVADFRKPVVTRRGRKRTKMLKGPKAGKKRPNSSNLYISQRNKVFSGWVANRGNLKFQAKWLTEFPFMEYDEQKCVMFCKVCKKFVNDWRRNSPFVVGSNNFRESVIIYHEQSSMHVECEKLACALVSQDKDAMEKDLFKDQLSHSFKSVYFIFQNKLSYAHYPQLCESQKREGADFIVYSRNLKVVPLFGKFICIALQNELAQKISHVSEFSLVIDASFQRHSECHDLIYIKHLDSFEVHTTFLGVIDSCATLHDSMFIKLTELFDRYGIDDWARKVVYIMTDRSDSRLWFDGLVGLIEEKAPETFLAEGKCLPHKLKFCAQVVQNHKVTFTFDALLYRIYCYYEKVDISRKTLTNMNNVLTDITQYHEVLPKNSFITIYFDTLKAVEQDYLDLVNLLEEEKHILTNIKVIKARARLLTLLKCSSLICKLALLIDVFSCLTELSEKLSNEYLLPYDVHMLLDEVCTDIIQAADGQGPMALKIAEEMAVTPGFFRGIKIVDNDLSFENILMEVKKFSVDLVDYLKSLADQTLLEKCFIFDVSLWPEDEELETFGNSEFMEIFLKFKYEEMHVDHALEEWNLFKSKVLTLFPFEVRQIAKPIIMKMVTEYGSEFPFVTGVLKKILLLNFESGEIQRGYNEMCLSKPIKRSILNLQSLQTAMMVSMHGPPYEQFDFSPALNLFLSSRHRHFRKKIIDKKLSSSSSDIFE